MQLMDWCVGLLLEEATARVLGSWQAVSKCLGKGVGSDQEAAGGGFLHREVCSRKNGPRKNHHRSLDDRDDPSKNSRSHRVAETAANDGNDYDSTTMSRQARQEPDVKQVVNAVRRRVRWDLLYRVLGIDRAATPDQIKRAYYMLSLLVHPDKNSARGAHRPFWR
jgi:DnaJ domain